MRRSQRCRVDFRSSSTATTTAVPTASTGAPEAAKAPSTQVKRAAMLLVALSRPLLRIQAA